MLKALKLSTRAAILNAGGAAALVREGYVRVKETALSFAGSAEKQHAERFVTIDTALDLDLAAGAPHHARALANAQDYELVPMRRPKGVGAICYRDIRDFKNGAHGVFGEMFTALEDEVVDAEEAKAILRALDEHDEQSRLLRAKCEAVL
ncbi:hypothetical protein NS226_21095 [Aureimonas ureilytica]|uniref:Uncharacterized protein n=2 Tax=Aureimonas ureilytica TaxID=401562 RepID=A0A175R330_9HYPH|nr:hypothetical protein NS226_21095 [Aureimonas ureilytica]